MTACPACDATFPEEAGACPWCGTLTTFSFDTAQGSATQASRATEAARKAVGLLRASGIEPPIAERLLDKASASMREEKPAHQLAYAQAAKRAAGVAKARARLRADLAR